MALTPLCPPPSLVPGDAHGNHPDAKLFFYYYFFSIYSKPCFGRALCYNILKTLIHGLCAQARYSSAGP